MAIPIARIVLAAVDAVFRRDWILVGSTIFVLTVMAITAAVFESARRAPAEPLL